MIKSILSSSALTCGALAFISSNADASSLTLDNTFYTNPNAWVYVWDNDVSTGSFETGTSWHLLKSTNDTTLTECPTDYNPSANDPVFVGYTFSYTDGKQILTQNDTAITATLPPSISYSRVYLGTNVKLTGTDNLFSGGSTLTFDFGDLTNSQSGISMGDFWKQDTVVNFAGTLTLSDKTFSYTLFESTKMYQNEGSWNASGFTVVDANGNKLTYDATGAGTEGTFWLEQVMDANKNFTISLKANAVPEPSVPALSLMALIGLLVRRRRKV